MAPNNLAGNLLFGVLALKVDVFDAPRFTKYCSAWAGRDEISLADWLVKRGWISSTDRAAVDHLVELKVRKHGSLEAGLTAAIDAEVMQAYPRIRRFVAGLAGADESGSGAGTRPSVHVADTLFTASKPQSPGSGGEILVSAMDRGSTPKTEDDLLSQPRQRGGVLRILVTAGVSAVVAGLICLGVGQIRLAEGNRRADEARE